MFTLEANDPELTMAGASFSGYIYCYSQLSCSVLSFLIRIVFMGLQVPWKKGTLNKTEWLIWQ